MGSGSGSAVFILLWLVLAILWLLVPFAVFGIKGLLRSILVEQKRTNELLERQMVSRTQTIEGNSSTTHVDIPEFKPPRTGFFG